MGRSQGRLLGLWAGLGALLLVGPAGAGPGAAGRHVFAGVERIVAVGDVHGDHEQFVKVLRAAKLIDAKDNWIAGKTHLVQTGDVLDRGPDSRKAMDLLMKLERQAAKAGGAVHALIGNHEAMVMMGQWAYVHPGEVKSFGGPKPFRKALSPLGKYGKWILGHKAVVKVNDVLFCHAGLTSTVAKMSLAEINQAVRRDMLKGSMDGLAMSGTGPLWSRHLALGEADEVAAQLDIVLKRYGARHLVVGHTVSRDGIQTRSGGRLFRIDVGMCRYYGGPAACLVIEKGGFHEVRPGGKTRKLDVPAAASRPTSRPVATQPVRTP